MGSGKTKYFFFSYAKRVNAQIGRWIHICQIICDVVNTLMASFMVGGNNNNNRYPLTVPCSHPWKKYFKNISNQTLISTSQVVYCRGNDLFRFWFLTSTSFTFYYSHMTKSVPQSTKVVYPPRLHDVNMLNLHFLCLSCYCLLPKKICFTLTQKPGWWPTAAAAQLVQSVVEMKSGESGRVVCSVCWGIVPL